MKKIYVHTEDVHNLVAPREVVPIIINIVNPKSVLDVGCGTGTWLKIFEESGISDFVGVDGEYVDRSLLKIPVSKFCTRDLCRSWSLNRKFDLAVSLEVGEHLPEENADLFVKTLTDHSDKILFSAAIPGQLGQHHINEQWPVYWQEKFLKRGFYFHDVIRPLIWNNSNVDWWYRQNIFLVTKERAVLNEGISMVHPELYLRVMNDHLDYLKSLTDGKQGLTLSAKILKNALLYKLRTLLRLP